MFIRPVFRTPADGDVLDISYQPKKEQFMVDRVNQSTRFERPAYKTIEARGRILYEVQDDITKEVSLSNDTLKSILGTDELLPDPNDKAWLNERDRLIRMGVSREDLLLPMNKPLGRDQKLIMRRATFGDIQSKSSEKGERILRGIREGRLADAKFVDTLIEDIKARTFTIEQINTMNGYNQFRDFVSKIISNVPEFVDYKWITGSTSVEDNREAKLIQALYVQSVARGIDPDKLVEGTSGKPIIIRSAIQYLRSASDPQILDMNTLKMYKDADDPRKAAPIPTI